MDHKRDKQEEARLNSLLTDTAEDHAFEHFKHRITSEGNVVTYAKELHDRSSKMLAEFEYAPLAHTVSCRY
jgi:hypothetical protein